VESDEGKIRLRFCPVKSIEDRCRSIPLKDGCLESLGGENLVEKGALLLEPVLVLKVLLPLMIEVDR
jgi:hypothetical protein